MVVLSEEENRPVMYRETRDCHYEREKRSSVSFPFSSLAMPPSIAHRQTTAIHGFHLAVHSIAPAGSHLCLGVGPPARPPALHLVAQTCAAPPPLQRDRNKA